MLENELSGELDQAAADNNNLNNLDEAKEEKTVPLSALQAERQQRQQVQEQYKILQDHLSLLQANQKPQQQEFDAMSDDDVMTFKDFKKIANEFQNEQKLQIEELKMAHSYPDYEKVIRKYVPELLKTEPDLKDTITNSPNPYKTAYYLAKRSDQYLKDQREQNRSPEAKKVLNNMLEPGNLSSVGQAPAGSASSSYKNMSDKDFLELVNRNLGYS